MRIQSKILLYPFTNYIEEKQGWTIYNWQRAEKYTALYVLSSRVLWLYQSSLNFSSLGFPFLLLIQAFTKDVRLVDSNIAQIFCFKVRVSVSQCLSRFSNDQIYKEHKVFFVSRFKRRTNDHQIVCCIIIYTHSELFWKTVSIMQRISRIFLYWHLYSYSFSKRLSFLTDYINNSSTSHHLMIVFVWPFSFGSSLLFVSFA